MTMANDLENKNAAPLGLPEGSIRAVLALLVVIGSMVMLRFDDITFEQLMAISGPVTALYFGQYIKSPQG